MPSRAASQDPDSAVGVPGAVDEGAHRSQNCTGAWHALNGRPRPADTAGMRPLFLLPCVLLALAVPLGAVAPAEPPPVPATTPAWAAAEIKVLVARGAPAASVETPGPTIR